jgi:hypothetical protein
MKSLIITVILFVSFSVFSQKNGNEWINYSQKYYSFKVIQEGVYKMDYDLLTKSGINLRTIQSENIQLFGREREVPLFIEDGGDNRIDSGDYVLFYAKHNDGWIDSLLYVKPTDIGNPAYSVANDTIHYFFTWNNASNNLRFKPETNLNYDNYQSARYFLRKVEISNYSHYGDIVVGGISSPLYKPGEGWTSIYEGVSAPVSINLELFKLDQLYTGSDAPPGSLEVKNASYSDAAFSGKGNHHLQCKILPSNKVIFDSIFTSYKYIPFTRTIPVQDLLKGNVFNWSIVNDQGAGSDRQGMSYLSLIYPTLTNFSNETFGKFSVPNSSSASFTKVDVIAPAINKPIVLTFGDQPRFLKVRKQAGKYTFLFPNSKIGNQQDVILLDESKLIIPSLLTPVNGTGVFTNFEKIISENAILMVYPKQLKNAAQAYANYRTSEDGGSNNVVFALIDELYLQFGGGVPKHFIAMRRFAKSMHDKSIVKPKALFLIGKAMYNSTMRQNRDYYAASMVPTFGMPSSDVALTAGVNGAWEPLVPTGRISVTNETDLLNYLEKVKEFENSQRFSTLLSSESNRDWQKNVLHFAGGSNLDQQSTFRNYMNSLKDIISKNDFSANVISIQKQTSAPIDPVQMSNITKKLSSGVAMMNFFGHSSASGFDIGVDEPSKWNNKGKYPFVLGNGCHAGDLFTTIPSYAEISVTTPNAGAIAFLATTGVGLDAYLYRYMRELYVSIAKDNYGNSFAFQMKKAIAALDKKSDNLFDEYVSYQMNLNGDPCLKVTSFDKPEIEIHEEDVFFTPKNINLGVDSITANIVLTNLGKTIKDTFEIVLSRKFPNLDADSSYYLRVPVLGYKDTVTVKFPLQPTIGIGLNAIDISVDVPSFVEEQYDESFNNRTVKPLYISLDALIPSYPIEFAIVPKDSITLKATNPNPIAQPKKYRFELDTVYNFSSPFRRYASVVGAGGTYEVAPNEWRSSVTNGVLPFRCLDSVVYYWRVAIDTISPQWINSSFRYLKGKTGWSQADYGQFKKNDFVKLNLISSTKLREYDTIKRKLDIITIDNANNNYDYFNCQYLLDNEMQEYGACYPIPSIHVAVIDPKTLKPWRTHYRGQNPDHRFGNANDDGACRQRVESYFIFRQGDLYNLENLAKMLDKKVPDGHHLIVYSMFYADFKAWKSIYPDLFSVFKKIGSKKITSTNSNGSFIFYCVKGDTNSIDEILSQTYHERLSITKQLYMFDNSGTEETAFIGPVKEWESVSWKLTDKTSTDLGEMTTSSYSNQYVLQSKQDDQIISSSFDRSIASLNQNQNNQLLRLKMASKDEVNSSPMQLKEWNVFFQPLPDASISYKKGITWLPQRDTIDEGEKVSFAIDVQNVSDVPMDSILIKYWITDKNQKEHLVRLYKMDSLRVGSSLRDTISFNSDGLEGGNTFWMEINPALDKINFNQPEQFHFNNFYQKQFFVKQDNINPLLDVTFDGKHLLNGDLIRPNPTILISLKDENNFLIMNDLRDTSNVSVFVTVPSGKQQRVPYISSKGEKVMEWIPATSQSKRMKINYPAVFSEDGTYSLLVQAADKTGNRSGDNDYKVSFEIVTASSMSYLTNYPNPFSTSTKFVYTLTGSTVPENLVIQILTISGKVVKEITSEELGPLEIGKNKMTAYAWDGKDEFGDPLANGVYLYRVMSKINGQKTSHRATGVDANFTKEFGKMYLLR